MRFPLFFLLLIPFFLNAETLRCSMCSKIIRGEYINSAGKAFCSQTCFDKTLPRCAACRKIIRGEAYEYKKQYYCSIPCMKHFFPKCDSCRQPIAGKYNEYETPEGKKRRLCLHCSQLSRCFACELPGRSTRLPDGRYLCTECAKKRLTQDAEKTLYIKVKDSVEQILGRKTDCVPAFYTVDYPELLKRSKIRPNADTEIELGFCRSRMISRKTGGITEIEGYDCSIYLLNNLPRERFIEIAAHELAHHWQYHHYPFLKRDPKKIQEGFAEYVSALVNNAQGQSYLNQRKLERNDFIYGAGYKLFRGIAEQGGLSAVFQYMKRNSE